MTIASFPPEWNEQRWRLNNLYWVVNEQGKRVPFRLNPAQAKLLDDLWYFNVILKSRQHGFTTLIDLLLLDSAVFTPDLTAGIIAHGLREAMAIFRNKILYPYKNLPAQITAAIKPERQSASELVLSNGSSIQVGTSMRSGTLQMLHVSEMGKISRRFPERAKEIVSGSLQAVHQGQFAFVESTAEGRDGEFHRIVTEAQKVAAMGRPLAPQEFRLHFFPWFADPRNTMDPEYATIGSELREYFGKLRADFGIELTDGQMAWYAVKLGLLGDSMKAEHPSTPGEAFEAAVDGAIYGREMMRARQRGHIGKFPHVERFPVNTFWDIGRKDATAIWFHQQIGVEHRFIDYLEDSLRPPSYYAGKLQERQMREGYVYGRHYLPHDAAIVTLASMSNKDGKSVEEQLNTAGVRPTDIVPQIADIGIGINETRRAFGLARFDQEKCDVGIANLEQYQYEFDERTETFRVHPRHDWSSNGADAFRQWGQVFERVGRASAAPKSAARSWKVA
jgi:hypothetical protein